jgi:hypothetical protein
MTTTPENLVSTAPDDCVQVLNRLMSLWSNEPDDEQSPAVLDHLCHCRSCLRKWIALEAAAELASFSSADSAEFLLTTRDSSGLS